MDGSRDTEIAMGAFQEGHRATGESTPDGDVRFWSSLNPHSP